MKKLLASLSILALMASPALADDQIASVEGKEYVIPQAEYSNWDRQQATSEPVVAVIQNSDQSSMHVLEVHNFGACRNLAISILRDKTEDQKRVNEELKHTTEGVWGRGFNNNSPDEVICISSGGHETLFTPNILAGGIVP
ncbi:hypothetical protein [Acetobacter pasteurianus]|uniref:hypothetical protein n=1 Tax=Acetobacter pasteurianus TaxID=438 RepID=UPI003D0F003D